MKSVLLPASKGRITHSENGEMPSKLNIKISAPNMQTAVFEIEGTSPLVINRFSEKARRKIREGQTGERSQGKKPKKEKIKPEDEFNNARYISKQGWDGFNASAIRCASISACRVSDAKMTLAKLCIFVVADGYDAKESYMPLVRIYGKPRILESPVRTASGGMQLSWRPCYDEWRAKLTMRFDADQFSVSDMANLLMRVGTQVGIGEGRNDSKESAGMGWGCFKLLQHHTINEKR